MTEHPSFKDVAVLDSDHSLELEQENMRLASGCMATGRSDLGAALKSEIRRLAGGSSTDREAGRKHELACLRMAADCMQLVGEIRTPDLQRHFLELARLLTAAAESTAAPALTNSI
jgi:hypothetical protein